MLVFEGETLKVLNSYKKLKNLENYLKFSDLDVII